jgi:hypothetical protein
MSSALQQPLPARALILSAGPNAINSSMEVTRDEIDETQIIYRYLKKHQTLLISCPLI